MDFSAASSMAENPFNILSLSTVGYIIVLCSVVAFAIHRFLAYYHLRQFSGPWLASFSKLWMMRCTFLGTMHLEVADVCNQYGTASMLLSTSIMVPDSILCNIGHLARISPNDLVTDDPEILRRMSAVRSPYTRSDWYDATSFNHMLNHVFSERDEMRHLDLRAKMTSGVCCVPLNVSLSMIY